MGKALGITNIQGVCGGLLTIRGSGDAGDWVERRASAGVFQCVENAARGDAVAGSGTYGGVGGGASANGHVAADAAVHVDDYVGKHDGAGLGRADLGRAVIPANTQLVLNITAVGTTFIDFDRASKRSSQSRPGTDCTIILVRHQRRIRAAMQIKKSK